MVVLPSQIAQLVLIPTLVTGKTYTGSTIEVEAPSTQGQLRVLVKDWKDGKIHLRMGAHLDTIAAKSLDSRRLMMVMKRLVQFGTSRGPIQPASVFYSHRQIGSFRTETINPKQLLSLKTLSLVGIRYKVRIR